MDWIVTSSPSLYFTMCYIIRPLCQLLDNIFSTLLRLLLVRCCNKSKNNALMWVGTLLDSGCFSVGFLNPKWQFRPSEHSEFSKLTVMIHIREKSGKQLKRRPGAGVEGGCNWAETTAVPGLNLGWEQLIAVVTSLKTEARGDGGLLMERPRRVISELLIHFNFPGPSSRPLPWDSRLCLKESRWGACSNSSLLSNYKALSAQSLQKSRKKWEDNRKSQVYSGRETVPSNQWRLTLIRPRSWPVNIMLWWRASANSSPLQQLYRAAPRQL